MVTKTGNNLSTKNLIIGAGLTGLSSAYHLNDDYIIAEAEESSGGTSGTINYDGFKLDKAVHILYFADDSVKDWISNELNVPLVSQRRNSQIWFERKYIPFPLQLNLNQLPVVKKIDVGLSLLMSIGLNGKADKASFAEWSKQSYGNYLYHSFYKPYNEKLWGTSIDNLTTEWMGNYIPKPSTNQMINSIFKSSKRKIGLNAEFYYPKEGGIDSVARAMERKLSNVQYKAKLLSVDYEKKTAFFENGLTVKYDIIINTIPLNAFLRLLQPSIKIIDENTSDLKYNATTILHILAKAPNIMKGVHWIYVPQKEIPFYRITLAHNISKSNCPEGWSSLTLELGGYHQKSSELEQRCLGCLKEMQLLDDKVSDIKFVWDTIECGYVLYDKNWRTKRFEVIKELTKYSVFLAGRYGRWEYSNMESALIQGREISNRINQIEGYKPTENIQSIDNDNLKVYFTNKYPKRNGNFRAIFFRRGESARVKQFKRLYPSTEGKSILDVGCGDGLFLKSILNGMPRFICLCDIVDENVKIAKANLNCNADRIIGTTSDIANNRGNDTFDLVLAIGLMDYYDNWTDVVKVLWNKCKETLIFDIPRSKTFHNTLRYHYLGLHKIRLNHISRADLDNALSGYDAHINIVELQNQFMIRMKRIDNAK